MSKKNKRLEKQFADYIHINELFDDTHTVLLAVSGGIDSMVMAYLFKKHAYRFAIAHCNFSLRGKEADRDEELVRETAALFKVPFYHITFDTLKYAKKHKISVQMAARELRYQWFEELYKEKKCDYIALAHHANDTTETFLINLIRGSGISGLHGIKAKKDIFVRPLLFALKQHILVYAEKYKIPFRDDQSNNEDKYIRNKIRHSIIPEMEHINPSVVPIIADTAKRLNETEDIFRFAIASLQKKLIRKKEGVLSIHINELKKSFKNNATLLFELLSPYAFNSSQVMDIMGSFQNTSGSIFLSPTHKILKDRNLLIIEPINEDVETPIMISETDSCIKTKDFELLIDTIETIKDINLKKTPAHKVFVDKDKLTFPLSLRNWETGDKFKPMGMKSFKKISDFFIDKKINCFQKQKIKLLLSDNKIVWVLGLRADDRFKIDDKSKHILRIQILPAPNK